MTTLSELGLKRKGNFLVGDGKNIILSETGANTLNYMFPSIREAQFKAGSPVFINGKLPRQEGQILIVNILVSAESMRVFAETDDWFVRKVVE